MTEAFCSDCGQPLATHSLVGCGTNQEVKPKKKRFRRINKMRTQKKKILKAGKEKNGQE